MDKMIISIAMIIIVFGLLFGIIIRPGLIGYKLAGKTCEENGMFIRGYREDFGISGIFNPKLKWVKCIDLESGKEVYIKGGQDGN